jgi:hypothetical protein
MRSGGRLRLQPREPGSASGKRPASPLAEWVGGNKLHCQGSSACPGFAGKPPHSRAHRAMHFHRAVLALYCEILGHVHTAADGRPTAELPVLPGPPSSGLPRRHAQGIAHESARAFSPIASSSSPTARQCALSDMAEEGNPWQRGRKWATHGRRGINCLWNARGKG